MGPGEVHYELFVCRKAGADWTLELATENRAQAIEAAEAMLAEHRPAAVKVCKETFDPTTGHYASLAILTRGDPSPPKKAKVRDEGGPLCVGPQDLYSVHARERIGRLLEGWLTRHGVTPFELLHRPDLVERLDASGLELQHALQKISIPEAQAHKCSVHEIIRRYRRLVDDAVARVLADGRHQVFPDVATIGFPAAVAAAAASDAPTYTLGGAVAGVLATSRTWVEKLALVLDLADAAPADGARRLLAFRVLEQPLGEILGSRRGMAALVGEGMPDLGAALAMMTRLMAPAIVEALIKSDPSLGGQFPSFQGAAERLAKWLADPILDNVRTALAGRILAELTGPRRLRPNDAAAEIQSMRAFAHVLILAGPRLVDPEAVQAAFLERSRNLLNADFVHTYLQQAEGGPIGEALALVRLTENMVGEGNKLSAARWLKAVVFSLRFERDLLQGPQTPARKLAHLAELEHTLRRIGLDEEHRQEIAQRIGEVGGQIESEAKLVHTIAHASAAAPQRLLLLLKLASGEAAPPGPVSGRARAEALRLVRDPVARTQLASAPDVVARAHELLAPSATAA